MSRSRQPTEEELALWRYVTRNVTPQPGRTVIAPPARHPVAEDPRPIAPAAVPPRPKATSTAPAPPLTLGASAGIDRRTAQRFARGDMFIDGRLDLHGFTLREAHDTVIRFVKGSAAAGRRCVLIVTGKGGGGFSDKPGRIRGEAIHWLSHAALRPLILAVREARPQHGGGGALYVLLKRQRVGTTG